MAKFIKLIDNSFGFTVSATLLAGAVLDFKVAQSQLQGFISRVGVYWFVMVGVGGGAGCREAGQKFSFGCDGVKLFLVGGLLESGLTQWRGVQYSRSPCEGGSRVNIGCVGVARQ